MDRCPQGPRPRMSGSIEGSRGIMNDVTTRRRLTVSSDGNAGPYIMVPVEQLGTLQALLDDHQIGYWVDEEAISLDGRPAITVINLGRQADPDRVQRLLDSVP